MCLVIHNSEPFDSSRRATNFNNNFDKWPTYEAIIEVTSSSWSLWSAFSSWRTPLISSLARLMTKGHCQHSSMAGRTFRQDWRQSTANQWSHKSLSDVHCPIVRLILVAPLFVQLDGCSKSFVHLHILSTASFLGPSASHCWNFFHLNVSSLALDLFISFSSISLFYIGNFISSVCQNYRELHFMNTTSPSTLFFHYSILCIFLQFIVNISSSP